MNSISRNWNPDENYWSLHPQMKVIKLFRELHDKDKSKGKAQSSKMMWAIALYVDPHENNPYKNVAEHDRRVLIAEDFLFDDKFPWDDKDIQDLIECYKDKCLSIAEKALIQLQSKIADRARFIDQTKYSMDFYDEESGKVQKGTADQLDKMMVNTIKIYEQMDKIREMLNKESIESQTKGGAVESAAEKGEL